MAGQCHNSCIMRTLSYVTQNIDITTVPDNTQQFGILLYLVHDIHHDLPLAPKHKIPIRSIESTFVTTVFDNESDALQASSLTLVSMLEVQVHPLIS